MNNELNEDEVTIEIQGTENNNKINELEEYIKNYKKGTRKNVIVMNEDYTLMEIKLEDIIIFFSDKKSNYCKTKDGIYKIRSKLYEVEEINENLIRISKSCIVNINHVEKFDISEVGKIIIKLDDKSEEFVSRRRTKKIMKFLDERRI